MGLRKELTLTNHSISRKHSPHTDGQPILRAENLEFRYNGTLALDGLNFEFHKGDRIAVVGPNGAGKSTLFKVIAGVLKPTAGKVLIAGDNPDEHICVAYVPQHSQVDWNFPVNVADVVMMGRVGQMGLLRWPKKQDWQAVNEALDTVRLSHLAQRQISELSGGQKQRMFIARALAQEAELMLMDEPLTGLDMPSQETIFQVLDELRSRGVTVLVSLHDLQMAADHFDRIFLLNRKLLAFGTPQEVLETQTLLDAYGSNLRVIHTHDGLVAVDDSCCDDGVHFHA